MSVELNKEDAVDDLDGQYIADTYHGEEGQLDDGRESDKDGDRQQRQDGAEVDVVRRVTVEVLVTVERDHRVHRAEDRRMTAVVRREHEPATTTHLTHDSMLESTESGLILALAHIRGSDESSYADMQQRVFVYRAAR